MEDTKDKSESKASGEEDQDENRQVDGSSVASQVFLFSVLLYRHTIVVCDL